MADKDEGGGGGLLSMCLPRAEDGSVSKVPVCHISVRTQVQSPVRQEDREEFGEVGRQGGS